MSVRNQRPPLRSTFASLRIRNYRLYFFGQLVSQVGTWMQSTALTRLTGPALAGVVLAAFGAAVCFYVNAVSFLAVIVSLFLMDPTRFHKVQRPKQAAVVRQLGEGLHYAVTTPDILLAVITMAVIG